MQSPEIESPGVPRRQAVVASKSLRGGIAAVQEAFGEGSSSTYTLRRIVANPSGRTTVCTDYTGPVLTSVDPPKGATEANPTRHRVAVFMGPDGTLFDANYVAINPQKPLKPEEEMEAGAEDVYDVKALEQSRVRPGEPTEVCGEFPSPDKCESYEEFESALLAWKAAAEKKLGFLQLPVPMGRHFFRPTTSAATTSDSSTASAASERKPPKDEGTPATAAEDEAEVEEWLLPLKSDPWEACLIPAEPKPWMYEELEQYEMAMKRWARETATRMTHVLPHPSQLQALIGITPAKEVFVGAGRGATTHKDTDMDIDLQCCARPGYRNPHQASILTTDTFMLNNRDKMVRPEDRGAEWDVAALKEKRELAEKSGLKHPELSQATVRVIGELAKERDDNYLNTGSCSWATRIDETMMSSGKLIQSLETHMDPSLISRDAVGYTTQAKLEYDLCRYSSKLLSLRDLSPEVRLSKPDLCDEYARFQTETEQMLVAAKPMTLECIVRALRSRMFLDPFKSMMEKKMPNTTPATTFGSHMCSGVNQTNFVALLQHWDLENDPLSRGKLSMLVTSLFKANPEALLRSLITLAPVDCHPLFILTSCLCFFDDLQPDVYPYKQSTAQMLEQVLRKLKIPDYKRSLDIVTAVFVQYYSKIIQTHAQEDRLTGVVLGAEGQLADLLQKVPTFLSPTLFRALGHTSVTVSNLMLVVLMQLLHSTSSSVQSFLRNSENKFFDNLRVLCRSHYTHVQFACRQISAVFIQDPGLRSFLFSYFSQNQTMLEDLQTNSGTPAGLIWFIQNTYLEALKTVVDQASAAAVSWCLGDGVFSRLFEFLMRTPKSNKVDAGTLAMATILDVMIEKSWAHKLIQSRDIPVSIAYARAGLGVGKTLFCSGDDITDLFNMITQLGNSNEEKVMVVRAHMLSAARTLLRHRVIFELAIKVDSNIYQKVLTFCRDGKYKEFNRQAWKLFKELIEYHANVLDFLDRSKLLGQFMDIVGTTIHGNLVMAHSLHYLGKIFSLLSAETRRMQQGLPIKRDDGKSIEKDIKTFITFFKDHHLFIKLHMVYKRFGVSQPGYAFIELAKLYHLIYTLPECQRLVKEVQKNEDYKSGLQRLLEMYNIH